MEYWNGGGAIRKNQNANPLAEPMGRTESEEGQEMNWLKNVLKFIRDFMYGATIHELDMELRKEKGHLDQLFMLVVFGDLVGLPLLPPYYSMRLLPYIVPSIETWKRRLLREKDLTDFVAGDL
jgi:hypothetical protein